MEISSLAGAAVAAQTGMARHEMSIAMVKQKLEADKAVLGLVAAATDQMKQSAGAASGGRGSVVDITA